jgi:tetratricopeptide (TPR) repeat protein
MPETGRILQFPARQTSTSVSPSEALEMAREYLSTAEEGRSEDVKEENLSNCDVLLAICKILRDRMESSPAITVTEASSLYRWAANPLSAVGVFDEREYVLGEAALIAAKGSRFLGKLSDAERWLDRSDAAFRHTVNPAPSLAGIAFERLALRYAAGRYEETLELLPSLKSSFKKLGMDIENAKTQFLEAVTLSAVGRREEHFSLLRELEQAPEVQECPSLHGQVLVHIGMHQAAIGQFETAARTYEQALPIVTRGNRPVALCELKWAIGDAYRAQGSLRRAIESYRVAKNDYQQLGFRAFVTKISLAIAETLLALGRDREAEWEILSALPMIEEEKMVPEGFAAVALLRESVRRRKTDPKALRELREHLQANS